MKYCVAVVSAALVIAVQALTDEQKAKQAQYRKECIASSGVDPELIPKSYKGEFVDDAKFKNYLFCFAKKAGFQSDDGDIKVDALVSLVGDQFKDKAEAEAVVKRCSTKKDTAEQTIFDGIKCYYEATHPALK